MEIRQKILGFAERYHRQKWQGIKNVVNRLEKKIYVIVGLNGKTTCSATRTAVGDWVLHKVPNPNDDNISNGDGTVLFQSTLLPGLPESQYWAEIPDSQKNTHGDITDRPTVIDGIKLILGGGNPAGTGLVNYSNFIRNIDWSYETKNNPPPNTRENLDYIERARLRSITPRSKWGRLLNPEKDVEVFATSRKAALRVLNGEDLNSEAARIKQSAGFLERHIQTLLMSLLY